MTKSTSIPTRISDTTVLLWLGLVLTVFHVLTDGQYGFHRDELDILMNAHQLDWGYVSYPPLTPFVTRLGLILFGDSLQGLRLFSAVSQGAVAVMAGWMARDFGGRRPAQILAALAVAAAPAALMAGTLIQYMAFDYLFWVLLAFCFVRVLSSEDPRWWLGVGVAVGLGMMTKYTIAFFIVGLAAAILLTSARRALHSPYLWAGAAIALLIFLPNLLWQIQHDFISLDFLSAIHTRDIAWGRTDEFLLDQLYITNNPFLLPLWIAGLCWCLLLPGGKRFRALAWAFLVTFGLLWAMRGRGYYLAPAYAMLVAAGAAWWEKWLSGRSQEWRRVGWRISWGVLAIAAIIGIALVKPLAPINSAWWDVSSEVNSEVVEMVGWPDLVEQVADIYTGLPETEKASTAILAGNYGEAGALDLYGPQYGLPPVISGSNSLWMRGYGAPPSETLIVVGFEREYALRYFQTCESAGRVSNRYGVKNEESTHHTGLYVCQQPRRPWPEMWAEMQWFQ